VRMRPFWRLLEARGAGPLLHAPLPTLFGPYSEHSAHTYKLKRLHSGRPNLAAAKIPRTNMQKSAHDSDSDNPSGQGGGGSGK
jgi:hypothetical protein